MEETQQMTLADLLPEQRPKIDEVRVPLEHLPASDSAAMRSPAPTPEMVTSMRVVGVINPVLLRYPDGEEDGYQVIAGRRRIKAARLACLTEVPARVIEDLGPLGADVVTLIENEQRTANPLAELEAIEDLFKAGASLDLIVQATGLSKQTVEKRLKLRDLPAEVLAKVGEGKVAISTAEEIVKQTPQARERLVAKLAEKGTLTGADVREERTVAAQKAVQSAVAIFEVEEPETNPWQEPARHMENFLKSLPEACPASLHKRLTPLVRQIARLNNQWQPGTEEEA